MLLKVAVGFSVQDAPEHPADSVVPRLVAIVVAASVKCCVCDSAGWAPAARTAASDEFWRVDLAEVARE